MEAFLYSDFLVMRDQDKDGGTRGPEPIHAYVRAAAEKAAAAEGRRDARPSKMLLASFETKSHGTKPHLTKVPETSVKHVSATYEKGESESPETEHEAANRKDLKINNFKDLTGTSLTYPDPVVTRYVIMNSLENVNAHLDALVKRARNKGGGSEGFETRREVTVKKDQWSTNFKVSIVKSDTHSECLASRVRDEDGENLQPKGES